MSGLSQGNKRYVYLDILKIIAIFFVCIYHFFAGGDVWYAENMSFATLFRRYLYGAVSTCVPLFMMANGALLLNKPLDSKKHFRKLLIILAQFWVWRAITIISLAIYKGINLLELGEISLLNIFLLQAPVEGISLSHLWFIYTLSCIYVLFPFIKQVFDRMDTDSNSRLSVFVLLGVLFASFVIFDFGTLKAIHPITNSIDHSNLSSFYPLSDDIRRMVPYFLLGGILHKNRERLNKVPVYCYVVVTVIGMSLLFVIWYIYSPIVGNGYDFILKGYGRIGTVICSCGVFLLVSKFESVISWHNGILNILHILGRNTMTVYYLHWILGYIFIWGWALDQNLLGSGSLYNIAKAAMLVLVCTVIGEAMKKIPFIRGIFH